MNTAEVETEAPCPSCRTPVRFRVPGDAVGRGPVPRLLCAACAAADPEAAGRWALATAIVSAFFLGLPSGSREWCDYIGDRLGDSPERRAARWAECRGEAVNKAAAAQYAGDGVPSTQAGMHCPQWA